jgi:hypothetical protein
MPTNRTESRIRSWSALSLVFLLSLPVHAQSPSLRIAAAVSPAPSTLRAGATVLGYDSAGKLVTLRQGTNDLICLADDARRKNFHVSCYYKALEPFMARGRELRAKGLSSDSADSVRAHEIRAGKLAMPKTPTALYQYAAPRNQVSDAGVKSAQYLYLVYMPYATPESTGFTAQPLNNGGPWLMYPGKPWAHLMIAPSKPEDVSFAASP